MGDWDNKVEEGTEQRFAIARVIVYPQYTSWPFPFPAACYGTALGWAPDVLEHDLALIVIEAGPGGSGMEFTQSVQPICLPDAGTPYSDGLKGTVAGWGSVGVRQSTLLLHSPLV